MCTILLPIKPEYVDKIIGQSNSGISKSKYMEYFENKDIAFAFKLGKVTKYETPKTLQELGINYYPQSYVYLNN